MELTREFKQAVLESTGAKEFVIKNRIQELWSGYGEIVRLSLKESQYPSVVIKHVRLPDETRHPRGWNTGLSHERKLKSYEVETIWYQKWSRECSENCRVPECLTCLKQGDELLIVLEDLDTCGFQKRKSSVTLDEMKACLSWLACFHATFMGRSPEGLWPIGTYWHLDTRPDELKVLDDSLLKEKAKAIDQTLNDARFKTFVHGDAKLANFCFSETSKKVAAVDFQYVGGGCGMKDVAYFIGSCLHENECQTYEKELLNDYFQSLTCFLKEKHDGVDISALEKEWRDLYKFAWTDFHRFIKGWSPGHWKINDYSEKLAHATLEEL